MSEPSPNLPTTTTNSVAPSHRSDRRKPRVALAIATAFGLGYLPKAPGTWGSLGGIVVSIGMAWIFSRRMIELANLERHANFWTMGMLPGNGEYLVVILVAILGVYVANQAAIFSGTKDP